MIEAEIVAYIMGGVVLAIAVLIIGGCIIIYKAVKKGIKESPEAQKMIQKGAEIARVQYKDELDKLNNHKK